MYSGSDDVVAMLEALAALGVDVVVSLQAPSNGSEARRWLCDGQVQLGGMPAKRRCFAAATRWTHSHAVSRAARGEAAL